MSAAWKTLRVFISSTFRDMMEERDELMTHAWPELRRFCRDRHVELVEVDLRWGIAEEQVTRKETLKLCLDEIRACRPFFISLPCGAGHPHAAPPRAGPLPARLRARPAGLGWRSAGFDPGGPPWAD